MGNAQVKVRRPDAFRQFLSSSSSTNLSSPSSSTNSVNTSQEHKEEWIDGRRVVSSSTYTFPVDPDFMDLTDVSHYTFRVLLGKNYLPPLKNPKKILDIGAGNGLWAKEMALEFPKAKIYALDMVEDMFNKRNSPDNVLWELGNILEGSHYDDNCMDFVHVRFLIGAIPSAKLSIMCDELFRVCRRGGYVAMADPSNVLIRPGPRFAEWHKFMQELCVRGGFHHHIALMYEQALMKAGFVDAKVVKVPVHIGEWAGDVGSLQAENMMRLGLILPVMLPELLTQDEAVKFNQDVFAQEVNHYRSGMEYVYVWAKKP